MTGIFLRVRAMIVISVMVTVDIYSAHMGNIPLKCNTCKSCRECLRLLKHAPGILKTSGL